MNLLDPVQYLFSVMTFAEALGHFDVVVEVVETERGVGPSRTLLPQEKRPKNNVKAYLTT